jgi:signal transduction histidine kinase
LLDNAIDAAAAAPGPRRVGFSGWTEDVRSSTGIASTLVLQVSDSGPGLDTASAARAFTRGWSTKSDKQLVGHGLGLALVGQATQRNSGTVEVGRADPLLDQSGPDGVLSRAARRNNTARHDPILDLPVPHEAAFVGAVFTVRFPLAVAVAP